MTPSVALSNTFAKNADIGRRERGDVKDSTKTNKTNRRNRQDTRQTRHTQPGRDAQHNSVAVVERVYQRCSERSRRMRGES